MKDVLQEYGLTENEINVFLTSLKLGKASATRISERTKLARSTTYDVLERLKSRGLVSTVILDNTTHYIASNPKVLLHNLDETKSKIRSIMPQLREMSKSISSRPETQIFQGPKGIMTLLEDILDTTGSLRIIGNQAAALERIGYQSERFRRERIKRGIKLWLILEDSPDAYNITEDSLTKIRFLNENPPTNEVSFISKNNIYHLILDDEITGIRITSKTHVQTMTAYFDFIWNACKKPNKS